MKTYEGLSYRFYVSVIYFMMGIIYLLYTGIDIPGYIDDFLNKNHHLMIFIVACGYFILSILYMYNQNVYKLDVEETTPSRNRKLAVVLFIAIILIYYLIRILQTIKF